MSTPGAGGGHAAGQGEDGAGDAATTSDSRMARRDFLSRCGGWCLAATAAGYAGATVEYLFPRVLYEPPTTFSVGKVADFPPGSATFLEDKRLFVFRASEGLYAVSSICTHLGCNVRWASSRERFECPCHGSVFDHAGRVVSGPAPRPLVWHPLTLTKTSLVVVETGAAVTPDFRLKV